MFQGMFMAKLAGNRYWGGTIWKVHMGDYQLGPMAGYRFEV
jgi:hypothetical protein